ncbi:hypothetical protein FACS189487_05350 [Campylobacterota bacterium]|nr:hypothetical protein FACS189487_05350 [Campylobacterota bacterium]
MGSFIAGFEMKVFNGLGAAIVFVCAAAIGVLASENAGDFAGEQKAPDRETLQELIVEYTKLIERDPKLALAYYNRADAYHDLGDCSNATKDITKAIEI